MQIVIGNDPDRDNLFAEIHDARGQPWAEVIFDDSKNAYVVTVFCGEEPEWPTVELSDFLHLLQSAKQVLVERGFPNS